MSENIRKAFELRLATLTPLIATAPENGSYTPVNGAPYQKINMIYGPPDNAVLGCNYYRETGFFQVTLFYPEGVGPDAAQARAELIRQLFPFRLKMTQGGTIVDVVRTPAKSPGFSDAGRYVVPIAIQYRAEIFG